MSQSNDAAFELPRLRSSFSIDGAGHDGHAGEFFDIKFCPFQPLNCDPVFAALSTRNIFLCRLSRDSRDTNPCGMINIIRDDDDEAINCCCTWVRDAIDQTPYICVGGSDAKVKIYGIDGRLIECFVGHGDGINDLTTSPVDSSIIASASDDTSVRLWSINPVHQMQPCLSILAGEGHTSKLLTVAFHDTGRYLLSAGHDQAISLWTVPSLSTHAIDTPFQVHYPHFSTTAVHSGIVDCVSFYGDQVLSRACYEDAIVLWRIEGFSL
ncbi:hypothetical protein ACCO45_004467 [Purpureocillium lilacinum]|uniref:Uncharacterized protein n=1 Tax=Purpureocillium lilacinum TaxID=33203 RepID=A0ACC4E2T7_PURLI